MDVHRFDIVSRLFAQRRLSRRRVVAHGGTAIAAGAIAASGLSKSASAQDATPEVAQAEKSEMLFVQSFQSGSIAPKEGEDGTYTLTLEQGLGQTIYFSDRPERIVGATPTQVFLDGLGFPPNNPPNAALVVEPAPGETDIAVLELFNPRYDEASHTATYDVQILKEYEQAIGMSFAEQPKAIAELQGQFGAAHLLIDDCASAQVACCSEWDRYWLTCNNEYVGTFPEMGYCYDSWAGHCTPMVPYCHNGGRSDNAQTYEYWAKQCNTQFPACKGICYPIFYP